MIMTFKNWHGKDLIWDLDVLAWCEIHWIDIDWFNLIESIHANSIDFWSWHQDFDFPGLTKQRLDIMSHRWDTVDPIWEAAKHLRNLIFLEHFDAESPSVFTRSDQNRAPPYPVPPVPWTNGQTDKHQLVANLLNNNRDKPECLLRKLSFIRV